MTKRIAKRLVVDASIGKAAGKTDHPVSKACRETLDEILTGAHSIVLTPDIDAEWKKHRSLLALKWLGTMTARKKTVRIPVEHDEALRQSISELEFKEKEIEAALKDTHLVEAACATDHIVLSLDETVRGIFSRATPHIKKLKEIHWANPVEPEEKVVHWLQRGAKLEKQRRLGFQNE